MRQSASGCVLWMLAACASEATPPGVECPRPVVRPASPQLAAAAGGAGGAATAVDAREGDAVVTRAGCRLAPHRAVRSRRVLWSAGPDPDNCGTLRLEQDVEITRQPQANILIVFESVGPAGALGHDPAAPSCRLLRTRETAISSCRTR